MPQAHGCPCFSALPTPLHDLLRLRSLCTRPNVLCLGRGRGFGWHGIVGHDHMGQLEVGVLTQTDRSSLLMEANCLFWVEVSNG